MKEAPTHCSFIFIATAVKEQEEEEEEEKKYEEDGRTDGRTSGRAQEKTCASLVHVYDINTNRERRELSTTDI